MNLGWLYISLCGRLSSKSFADGFWRLAFIDSTVHSFTPTRNSVGYPLDHWALLAFELAAAWPLFALTAKRLRDGDRPLSVAVLAAVALPLADVLVLASDYGVLDISRLPAVLIFCIWTWLMWRIYRLPSDAGINQFGPPQGDLSRAKSGVHHQS